MQFPDLSQAMPDLESAPEWRAWQNAAQRYRGDAAWRGRIDAGDNAAISGLMADVGLAPAPGARIAVRANDDETFHFVLPPDPNAELADESLAGVVGGAQASTMSSVSSAGTFGCSCGPSTLGSAGCVGAAAPS